MSSGRRYVAAATEGSLAARRPLLTRKPSHAVPPLCQGESEWWQAWPVEAGDWIAVYGAVVATGVAAWQAIAYWVEHRPKVRLSSFLITLVPEMKPAPATDTKAWLLTLPWRLQIEVLNLGRSAVAIGRIDVRTKRTESGYTSLVRWTGTFPGHSHLGRNA